MRPVALAVGLAIACTAFGAAEGAKEERRKVTLGHWSGCPRMFYWDDAGSCRGTYDYLTDSSWKASGSDGQKVVAHFDGMFHCCDTENYKQDERTCELSHSSGSDKATCVYERNFCPTVGVENGTCGGHYSQRSAKEWIGYPGVRGECLLKDNRTSYIGYQNDQIVEEIVEGECQKPDWIEQIPLYYGWNTGLPGIQEDTYYQTQKRMPKPKVGVIPLEGAERGRPLKIWFGGSPQAKDEGVVILQLHNKNRHGAYPVVSKTFENSFIMRVVTPPKCPEVATEDVSVLFTDKGHVVVAGTPQAAEAGWATVAVSDSGTFVKFEKEFSATPVVLTTMRENTALPDFIHPRVISVTPAGFKVVLETEAPYTTLNALWKGEINYFAMHTGAEITGLFGSRKYSTYLSAAGKETISHVPQTFTFPFAPVYDEYAIFEYPPDVFVASQSALDVTPVEVRIYERSAENVSFALREDSCTRKQGESEAHTENVFGVIAWGAYGDRFKKYTTTTTTQTTTSTTTFSTTTITTTTESTESTSSEPRPTPGPSISTRLGLGLFGAALIIAALVLLVLLVMQYLRYRDSGGSGGDGGGGQSEGGAGGRGELTDADAERLGVLMYQGESIVLSNA